MSWLEQHSGITLYDTSTSNFVQRRLVLNSVRAHTPASFLPEMAWMHGHLADTNEKTALNKLNARRNFVHCSISQVVHPNDLLYFVSILIICPTSVMWRCDVSSERNEQLNDDTNVVGSATVHGCRLVTAFLSATEGSFKLLESSPIFQHYPFSSVLTSTLRQNGNGYM